MLFESSRGRSQSGYGNSSGDNKMNSGPGTPNRPVLAQKILQQSREAETALSDALVSTLLYLLTFD